MKNVLKILCAALLLAATVFTFASCATIDGMKEDVKDFLNDHRDELEDEITDEETAAFQFNLIDGASLSLCSAEVEVVSSSALVEKQLTAIVEPANAVTEIEWEVYWITNPFGEDAVVTDYVTVTPSVDDSKVAIVGAHQAFRDAVIGVKATTVVGGYSAVCEVSFIGKPNLLNANAYSDSFQDQIGVLYDDEGRYELAKMGTNETLTFEVFTSNAFGYSTTVGSNTPCLIGENMKMTIDVEGTIKMNYTSIFGETSVVTMDADLEQGEEGSDPANAFFEEFTHVILDHEFGQLDKERGYVVGYVCLDLNATVETYLGTYTYAEGIENLRFIVTIVDSENQLRGTFSFSYKEAVTGINLDNSQITF